MCLPKCMAYKLRKSRKEHKCCECGKLITKGQMYHYTSGVWEEAQAFKQCYLCGYLFLAGVEINSENGFFEEFGPMYEDLAEWIKTFRLDYGKTAKETLKLRANEIMELASE